MQDKYISLDPAHADSTSDQVRRQLWKQRIHESNGGDAASVVGVQAGLTGGLLTWAKLRSQGFRMQPFTASNIPKVSAIAGMTAIAWFFGRGFVSMTAGDARYYDFLIQNRGKILKGEVAME